ncbi:hypothetical protein CXG81DRAFT_29092 [Caulochytrium protostelioides]|uniref:PCI domain-containing protein n=1 Tax=Caulochytrium protostelioides TaxID=1555241 RepID=A0A4P9XEZ3_9FUNG|nr:hypothetical protein CXG81DRAFT_29092 [Caulochytrium protostelioides]|eukprot:RKP04146.1 hypothetical protein CXG81DRAFT_29092 [Caulochytrium protostelioides]
MAGSSSSAAPSGQKPTDAMAVDPAPAAKSAAEAKPAKPVDPQEQFNALLADIRSGVQFVERAVAISEARYMTRALRAVTHLRAEVSPRLVQAALAQALPKGETQFLPLCLPYLAKLEAPAAAAPAPATTAMDVDTAAGPNKAEGTDALAAGHADVQSQIEVGAFLALLLVMYLHDKKAYAEGMALSTLLIERIQQSNRRTLDYLASRHYFYFARFHELQNRLPEIRPLLLNAHRVAALRNDDAIQATVLNLLLRDYLQHRLIDQADKLVSKTTFPESASNQQAARYLYYLGRIKALQLEYTASHGHLLQAIHKAPQTRATRGFLQAAQKLSILVQLLMGEVPARSLFREPHLAVALAPYLALTRAVRAGDLHAFSAALQTHAAAFRADATTTLILRLRHNVIKTGLRRLTTSYSRIALRDLAVCLQLDSEEDAEFIVAKAIRDGVIDAVIDHAAGTVRTREVVDVYATSEPQDAFHQRIAFCLQLHNASVKAMRFEVDAHRKELENADALREEERKLVSEIIEGDLMDDDEL